MNVGDIVKLAPSDYVQSQQDRRGDGFGSRMAPPTRAVVVYVHPEGRFYTVKFEYRFGSFCESFSGRGDGRKQHGRP